MSNNTVVLVTGSYDHTLVFWDALSGQSICTYEYNDKVMKTFIRKNGSKL